MITPCRHAAAVALALIEEAPDAASAERQTELARGYGAGSNEIRRAWQNRLTRLRYVPGRVPA